MVNFPAGFIKNLVSSSINSQGITFFIISSKINSLKLLRSKLGQCCAENTIAEILSGL